MLHVRRRHSTPNVFTNEGRDADHHGTGVVVRHARRRCPILVVLALGGGDLTRMTQHVAQQPGILPDCEYQHDGNDSYSKHVMLGGMKGKNAASRHTVHRAICLGFEHCSWRVRLRMRNFPRDDAGNLPPTKTAPPQTAAVCQALTARQRRNRAGRICAWRTQ